MPCERMEPTLSYRHVVQPSYQAVVSIYTSGKAKDDRRGGKFNFGPFSFEMPDRAPQKRQALGSGVIVRDDGLVITNNHVIAMADEIKVVLADGRTFDAHVVVKDPDCDLAALRFTKTDKNAKLFEGGFPKLPLGRGDECEVGDVVLAIGNNLGLQGTVTQGIISAVGRFMDNKSLTSKISVPLIQTSASINPGSSGGALVNMKGNLVGINTAIVTTSGGNIGLAFAVPANYIIPVLDAVDQGRKTVRRPYIGCTLGKLPYPDKGVLVHNVMKNGPAAKAGVVAKDVIVALGDRAISDSDRFLMMISLQKIGENVRLKVRRGGTKDVECTLRVGEWKKNKEKILVIKDERNPLEGTTLGEMSPTLNSRLGLDAAMSGVVVIKVSPGSTAEGLFQPKDNILQVDDKKISSIADLVKAIEPVVKSTTPTVVNIRVARGEVVIEFRLSVGPPRSKL
uniref:PDZ domain-containing protein n=1 Tax=Lotharella oceanica TaxID=641309 RepID=A0A7S2XDD3_9EUKA